MAVVSYASAAAAATTPGKKPAPTASSIPTNGKSTTGPPDVYSVSNGSDNEDLFKPPPTSLTLAAALSLLDSPLVAKTMEQHVFLITKDYLQNYLYWAYNQPVPQDEVPRLQKALRQAAHFHRLKPPSINTTDYRDPGPIWNKELSDQNDPLLLREGVAVTCGQDALSSTLKLSDVTCCAVPEPFYDVSS